MASATMTSCSIISTAISITCNRMALLCCIPSAATVRRTTIAIQRRFANSRRPATPMRSGCTREQLTNTYDNTILYVDYVVDKAIKLLQSKQDKFTTRFICPTTANRWVKMASICMVCRIPSRRIRRNMCRWRCGSPPTTSSATVFPRTVCSSGRKRELLAG